MKLEGEIRNRRPKLRSASGKGGGSGSQIDRASKRARIGARVNSAKDDLNG